MRVEVGKDRFVFQRNRVDPGQAAVSKIAAKLLGALGGLAAAEVQKLAIEPHVFTGADRLPDRAIPLSWTLPIGFAEAER